MRYNNSVFLATFIILLLPLKQNSLLIFYANPGYVPTNYDSNLKRCADFLLNQYNVKLRLVAEAPIAAPDTYWLVSDNLFACHALKKYYPDVADEIETEIKQLAVTYNLPRDSKGYPISYKHESVIGDSFNLPFKTHKNYTLYDGVKTEVWNQTVMNDWEQYADLCLYASLSLFNQNNLTGANYYFDKAVSMWNGKGLNDKSFRTGEERGKYITFKLALLLYTSHIINRQLTFKNELESILWATQRESDGGMVTHYNGSVTPIMPIGDANSETTSLTILAYTYSPVKEGVVALPWYFWFIIGIIVWSSMAIAVLFIRRRHMRYKEKH